MKGNPSWAARCTRISSKDSFFMEAVTVNWQWLLKRRSRLLFLLWDNLVPTDDRAARWCWIPCLDQQALHFAFLSAMLPWFHTEDTQWCRCAQTNWCQESPVLQCEVKIANRVESNFEGLQSHSTWPTLHGLVWLKAGPSEADGLAQVQAGWEKKLLAPADDIIELKFSPFQPELGFELKMASSVKFELSWNTQTRLELENSACCN